MPGYYQKYYSSIKNFEGQYVNINIIDKLSELINPYDLSYSVVDNGNGTQTLTIPFSNLPADADNIRIAYSTDGGATFSAWTDFAIPPTVSPIAYTVPAVGDFIYLLQVQFSDPMEDDENYILNEMEGVTDTLEPSGDPFHLISNNNAEDKMNPIASTQLVMEFNAQDNSLLNKLLRGTYSDRRYYTTADINGRYIFKGYMNLADVNEPFLPRPTITFTANDGLASLKNKTLKDFNDENPTGKHKLCEFIAWCLRRTGVEENFNVICNYREGTGVQPIGYGNFSNSGSTIFFPIAEYTTFYAGQKLLCTSTGLNNGTIFTVVANNYIFGTGSSNIQVTPAPVAEAGITNFTLTDTNDGHLFLMNYLDAKTWETEVGECEDCYTVLTNLFKKLGTLGQRHGEWWFKNFDEYDTQPDYVSVFDSNGDFVEALAGAYYNKEIGIDKNMWWSDHSGRVAFSSPGKMAKLVQRYDIPKEVPCNVDFERGAIETDTPTVKTYDLECWSEMKKHLQSPVAGDCDRYIERIFVDGYEKERYLVITAPPDGSGYLNYTESEPVVITAQDKIELSIEYAWVSNAFKNGFWSFTIGMVRLEGDDGSHWTLDNDGQWKLSDATWSVNLGQLSEQWIPDDVNETEVRTKAVSSYPAPVDGNVIIMLFALNQHTAGGQGFDDVNIRYNISLTYVSFINFSYQKYSGQHHKVERTRDDNESVDDVVYIDNFPNRLLKGSLQKWNGAAFVLSGRFWNAAVFPGCPPDVNYLHPFGYIRVFNVWNQIRLLNRIFRGSIQGIESDTVDARDKCDLPSLFHSYHITDTDEHSTDKKFMLLNFDIDLSKCAFASASFKEVFNEAVPKDYADPYEFKYITQ